MKKVFNNTSVIASKMFLLLAALIITFCLGFIGKGFDKATTKKDRMAALEMTYASELNREEELHILNDVMTSGVEEVVETPAIVKVYAANGNLLYQASGSQLALLQDQKLNDLLESSDLMMEMAGEFYYLKK